MSKNYAYLINVNANANNNKYYEVTLNNDNSIDVCYGRVGVTAMKHHYEPKEKDFYCLINDKLRKGYEDRTALHSEIIEKADINAVKEELSYEPVEDKDVQEALELFITSSREFMKKNYTVSSSEITVKMIDEAQNDINILNDLAVSNRPNVLYEFNKKLQELFTDIPRKMGRVDDFLAKTEQDFSNILNKEQEMLDNVKGAVTINKVNINDLKDKKGTVLEAYGITMRPVSYKEEDQIVAHLGDDYDRRKVENRFVKAFVVENQETRKNYEEYKEKNNMTNEDVRLFYHGSKVENWFSIMKTGLLLNPQATVTGKMFGQGLYFAPECRKALNYMDTKGSHWNAGTRHTGYTAVYSVALGKCYKPDHILGSSFREKDLPDGTNSVFADKKNPRLNLINDEYIVYNQEACTIKYLVEMSEKNVRTKEFNLNRDILRNSMSKGFDNLVKTSSGVKAEIIIEQLPKEVQNEFETKITKDFDYKSLFVDYNIKTDRISFEIETYNNGKADIHPNLTNDDYSFLSREMKKSFVESEKEWNKLMEDIKDYPLNKSAVNKNGIVKLKEQKKKNDIVKE